MTNFVSKTPVNSQKVAAYTIYMVVGSYFHKAKLANEQVGRNLYLHYADLSDNRKVQLEEGVIRMAERVLSEVKGNLAISNCKVTISQEKGAYLIAFYTGFENVVAAVDRAGKYRIWVSES